MRTLKTLTASFSGRVYRADTQVEFCTLLEPELADVPEKSLRVRYVRDDWRASDLTVTNISRKEDSLWEEISFRKNGRELSFQIKLCGEHEHAVMIIHTLENGDEFFEKHAFYTVEKDLAAVLPYKGNVHTHSTLSDGRVSPEEALCTMRSSGFDFFALTDHNRYHDAFPEFERYGSGFVCFAGEEASSTPLGVNHILSLGSSASIAEWQNAPDSDFHTRVAALEKEEPYASLPPHERTLAAQTETIFRKIRSLGGVSVFCHPYWVCESRYYSTPEENDCLLRHGSFDALEIGNYKVERMCLLNARIMELARECGFRKPFIGASDWHARPIQFSDKDYTMIFAPTPEFEDFARAIRSEYCVAVGGYQDEFTFGSFRLVQYANFLRTYFFQPLHDPLCKKQGELLLEAHRNNATDFTEIVKLKTEIDNLYKSFFVLD